MNSQNPQPSKPSIPHLRIAPHVMDVRQCLYFDVIDRDVPEGTVLKIGRFTEKVSQQYNRIAFKSKVVSRSHAEIWTENGQFYIKDTKSSSGTFLNHMRLSPPSQESTPHPIRDGDIIQLGVDYQGGTQDIYKCVKMRVEINRNWQKASNHPFRLQTLKTLQQITSMGLNGETVSSENCVECCICLYAMKPFQALFIAPCAHCFHYKCIKPIVFSSTSFTCPLCRTYADLEESVTVDDDLQEHLPVKITPQIQQATQADSTEPISDPMDIDQDNLNDQNPSGSRDSSLPNSTAESNPNRHSGSSHPNIVSENSSVPASPISISSTEFDDRNRSQPDQASTPSHDSTPLQIDHSNTSQADNSKNSNSSSYPSNSADTHPDSSSSEAETSGGLLNDVHVFNSGFSSLISRVVPFAIAGGSAAIEDEEERCTHSGSRSPKGSARGGVLDRIRKRVVTDQTGTSNVN